MNFNRHSNLAGTHAFLSPSSPAWLNYDEDKLDRLFHTSMAARRGTDLHALANECIRLGVRLPEGNNTLNMYVNDAIGFHMTPEQILYFSDNCYGQADTIGYRNEKLRIHDYKSGIIEASFHQVEIYEAIFCLEYKINPFNIGAELRIYQNNEVKVYEPDPDDIFHIMERIKSFDRRINRLKQEVF